MLDVKNQIKAWLHILKNTHTYTKLKYKKGILWQLQYNALCKAFMIVLIFAYITFFLKTFDRFNDFLI